MTLEIYKAILCAASACPAHEACTGTPHGVQQKQDGEAGATCMAVSIHGIGRANGQVAQQAEAVAASWVVCTCHHACWASMMTRGPYSTKGISSLHDSDLSQPHASAQGGHSCL